MDKLHQASTCRPFDCTAYILGRMKKLEFQLLGAMLPRLSSGYKGSLFQLQGLFQKAYQGVPAGFNSPRCTCKSPLPAMQARGFAALEKAKDHIIDDTMEKTLQRYTDRIGLSME